MDTTVLNVTFEESLKTIVCCIHLFILFAVCTEAYTVPQDRYSCRNGCNFMAKQRASGLLSLLYLVSYLEEGVDSNKLQMSPDIPENDILSDPGLRKELLPGWWDFNGFKLPQTYIRTVPLDAGVSF